MEGVAGATRSRTIGIGMDYSPTSLLAVRYVVDYMVGAGDRIILVHVVSKVEDHQSQKWLWGSSGSPLVPLSEFREPNVHAHYDVHPSPEVLDVLDTVSREKQVVLMAKIYWGDPRDALCESVKQLKLDSLVVGSRGLGMIKRVLLGSVSQYVVHHADCPVTVVKGPKSLHSAQGS